MPRSRKDATFRRACPFEQVFVIETDRCLRACSAQEVRLGGANFDTKVERRFEIKHLPRRNGRLGRRPETDEWLSCKLATSSQPDSGRQLDVQPTLSVDITAAFSDLPLT